MKCCARTITKLEVDNCSSLQHFNIHSFHRNWIAYCAFQKHTNSKGAFDWEIWITILKSRFRICSRTRNSTLRHLVLDFPFYRSIGKSEKGFEKLSLGTAVLHAHA